MRLAAFAASLALLAAACGDQYGQEPPGSAGDVSPNAAESSNPGSAPDAAISPSNTDAPDPLKEHEEVPAAEGTAPATTTP